MSIIKFYTSSYTHVNHTSKRLSPAFMLLEALLVCGLLATICCLSIAPFLHTDQETVTANLSALSDTCLYLSQRAMASNNYHELFIEPDKQSYFYIIDGKQHNFTLIRNALFGSPDQALGPPSNPTNLITQPATFSPADCGYRIIFYPNGKISPGALYVTDHKKRVGGALTCSISQVSYIRKYALKSGIWEIFQ